MPSSLPPVHDLLPHRGRWLLLKRLVSFDGSTLVAEGRFDLEDVEGHFPGMPIVPGVALVEGIAQATACLSGLLGVHVEGIPALGAIANVRFRNMCHPPADVLYRVTLEHQLGALTRCRGRATCDEIEVATAVITATRIQRRG